MILTKEVTIKLNAQNIKHYRNLGYKCNPNDQITVKPEELSIGSNYKIKVKCDKCETEKEIKYTKYIKNINNGGYYSCSNKCSIDKFIKNNLDKFGEVNPAKTPQVKIKIKNTKNEKYGNENYNNIEKNKNTCIEKYGVKNVFQLDEIKEKVKKIILEKYGVENVFQNEHIKEIRNQTMMNKYGVKYYSQLDYFKEYIKNLNIDYEKTHEKMKKTCLERYGVEYAAQNIDIYKKTQKTQLLIKKYKGIKYQGSYELDFLILCDNLNILNEISVIKSLKYSFENNIKIYYPDYYIQKLNMIVEIKSLYYYNLMLEKNIAKQKSCIDQNYNFIFVIDKNYSEFLEKIKAII